MADTMIYTNEHGEVCPAGWRDGDEAMKPTSEGVAEYLSKNSDTL
jgi:peroxiredoxin (alkyl hydroperoxide reductase subunit C)